MKDRRIQTKRKTKRGFRALYAKTLERKQKASTATADMDEIEGDIPRVGIGRALTVILVLHIVAIAAIYIGTKWKGPENSSNSVVAGNDEQTDVSSKPNNGKSPKFRVSKPSSYAAIEQQQRSSQVIHRMPSPDPDNPTAIQPPREVHTPAVAGNKPAQPAQRRPRVIRPKRNPNAHVHMSRPKEVKYKTHTVVSGDSIYRLALRNKVKQQEILNLNNIADASKIRVGMKLKIPVK